MNDHIVKRINSCLEKGGLHNPELADHTVVRDLLIDCKNYITIMEQDRREEMEGMLALRDEFGARPDETFYDWIERLWECRDRGIK